LAWGAERGFLTFLGFAEELFGGDLARLTRVGVEGTRRENELVSGWFSRGSWRVLVVKAYLDLSRGLCKGSR
jgi:hypothetical protein